jgi:outer membrane biosynthesis protein TonB
MEGKKYDMYPKGSAIFFDGPDSLHYLSVSRVSDKIIVHLVEEKLIAGQTAKPAVEEAPKPAVAPAAEAKPAAAKAAEAKPAVAPAAETKPAAAKAAEAKPAAAPAAETKPAAAKAAEAKPMAAPVAEAKPPAVAARKSRQSEDARRCLELPSNAAIVKCTEELR